MEFQTMNPKLLLCLALVLNDHCFAAIIYPPAPDGGRQMVYTFVSKTIQAIPDFLHGIHIGDVAIAEPYQSYSIGPSNLLAGKLVAAAKPGYGGGWIYLLTHDTNCVGDVYLKADEKTGKALKCTELDQAGNLSGILEALRIAGQLPQVKKQNYELRSLDMPWYLFHAVWLHGETNDIIIPLPDT
jgi:hypothetical protein